MPKIPESQHTGELGVTFVQTVCARARVIFRPIRMYDVGIDGIIEPQVGQLATGMMIGVQIKSGASFRREADDKVSYLFKSDQAHFKYWARCSLPMIGVVYDPDNNRGFWVNLTAEATPERIFKGPYTLSLDPLKDELNHITIVKLLENIEYHSISRGILSSRRARLMVPQSSLEHNQVAKTESWEELLELFLSVLHDERTLADAGYRLSRYFPSISEGQRAYSLERLQNVHDLQLVRIVSAMATVMKEDNADPVAEHMCMMLQYVPDAALRLEKLLSSNALNSGTEWAGIQAIEALTETERPDLWNKTSPDEGSANITDQEQ